MKNQVFNPYLPLWEHVPDGEPHVFGDRLYIYGSHDRAHGTTFCMEDYVCWSAPVSDLSDWRYEGVIWEKTDDPDNHDPVGYLYAPDIVRGKDGRYYLYYFYTEGGKHGYDIRVAACDSPCGHFQYYGCIDLPDTDRFIPFDPSIFVDDDGRVYLYYGSAFQFGGAVMHVQGGAVVELMEDMKTVLSGPTLTIPNVMHQKGTSFEGHAFFEASSMRKINGKYYLIYSSMLSHELCYGVSGTPKGPFTYGGTIISNGDIGYKGSKTAVAPTGNNHGGLVCVNGQWYIFYHRHTCGTGFSRQGCAEPVTILSDGRIPQVEITSCGLNGGPLSANGVYPAAIACNIFGGKQTCVEEEREGIEPISFISHMSDGAVIGFKYIDFGRADEQTGLQIRWRVSLADATGFKTMTLKKITCDGSFQILTSPDGPVLKEKRVASCGGDWEKVSFMLPADGVKTLYIRYRGKGAVDVKEIRLKTKSVNLKQVVR